MVFSQGWRHVRASNDTQRPLQRAKADDGHRRSSAQETIWLTHEFSQVPVHHDLQTGSPEELTVNAPGDIYEQEADGVSEEIMRQAGSPHSESGGRDQVNNIGPERFFHEGFLSSASGSSSSYGQPLDSGIRSFMEPRFGHDFSQIRVHTGSAAADSARALGVRAYTV